MSSEEALRRAIIDTTLGGQGGERRPARIAGGEETKAILARGGTVDIPPDIEGTGATPEPPEEEAPVWRPGQPIHIDADIQNADWLKGRSGPWPFEATNVEDMRAELAALGRDVAGFRETPFYQRWAERLPWLRDL